MKLVDTLLACALFGWLFLGVLAGSAHAYLDPGTGSLLLQAALAVLAAAAVGIRTFRQRIGAFFRRLTGTSRDEAAPPQE